MQEEIKSDLKAIRSDISDIKTNIAVNTVSLQEHMARTRASEVRIEYLERVFITLAGVAVLGGLATALIKTLI